MKKVLLVALAVGLVLPLMSGAQEKKGKKTAEEQFKAMDANNDMKLTKDEFLARVADDKKSGRDRAFGRWDKNSDGSLTIEEYKEGMASQKKKK